ncbi:uncharacterized protein [Centruroides vittatus]|uniref:uncharacterized protein n=1 Tax=Centruroides vittatus TaxID=120091 RepID=UPI00350FDFD5
MVNNKYCCVFGCKSKGTSNSVHMHTFPKDKLLRKKWEIKLKLGKQSTKSMYVCSLHFDKDDYYLPGNKNISYKYILTVITYGTYVFIGLPCARHYLKPNSYPTKNIPIRKFDTTTSKQIAEQRSIRAQKRQEIRNKGLEPANKKTIKEKSTYQSNNDTNVLELSQPSTSWSKSSIDCCACTDQQMTSQIEEDEDMTSVSQAEKDAATALLNLSEKSNIQEERDILMEKGIQVNTLLDSTLKFTVFDLIKSDNELNILTGLNSFKMLDTISACVSELQSNNTAYKPTTISTKVQIVLVMMKLKLALPFACVSVLFQISMTTCRRIFFNIIAYLSQVLGAAIVWPSKEEIMKNLPLCFQKYSKVRVILDCTEVLVEKPKCISCRILTYSHYYGKHTVKVLVGIAPSGLITYLSKAYGGRASDKAIFEESNLLNLLDPYADQVMTDKGFHIEDACSARAIGLVRPPFVRKQNQLSKHDALETAEIAKARVHVERAIQRMKLFAILKQKLDWTLLPHIDKILTIICGVVNLSRPILGDDKF